MFSKKVKKRKSADFRRDIIDGRLRMSFHNMIKDEIFIGNENFQQVENFKKKLLLNKFFEQCDDLDVGDMFYKDGQSELVRKLKDLFHGEINAPAFGKWFKEAATKKSIQKINYQFTEFIDLKEDVFEEFNRRCDEEYEEKRDRKCNRN